MQIVAQWSRPQFIEEYRSKHKNWKRIATLEIITGALMGLRRTLRDSSVSWDRPIAHFKYPVIHTQQDQSVHFHFGFDRSHSHLSDCCNDAAPDERAEICRLINQFEVLIARTGAIMVSRNDTRHIALFEKTAHSLKCLPEFARNAYLTDMLKPGRLGDLKAGAFSENLKATVTDTKNDQRTDLSILTEVYPLALDMDNLQSFFTIEVGLLIENAGLLFKRNQDDFIGGIIEGVTREIEKLLNDHAVTPNEQHQEQTSNVLSLSVLSDADADLVASKLAEKLEARLKPAQKEIKTPRIDRNDFKRKVGEYLSRWSLSEKQAEALVLKYQFSLNASDSARYLNVTRQTIEERLVSGQKRLGNPAPSGRKTTTKAH